MLIIFVSQLNKIDYIYKTVNCKVLGYYAKGVKLNIQLEQLFSQVFPTHAE